jgi:hypothetical protein
MLVDLVINDGAARVGWRFNPLPARPLVRCALDVNSCTGAELEARLRTLVTEAPADAVLTIHVEGNMTDHVGRLLSAANLRSLAPTTMNVELRFTQRGRGNASAGLPSLDL